MKRMKFIYTAALAFAVVGCSEKIADIQGPQAEMQTISVSIADKISKVALEQGVEALDLTWEEGDQLNVIGQTSETYTLASGAGEKSATFTGAAVSPVEGTGLYIVYPAKYSSQEAIYARSYEGQIQEGNESTAHLEYNAVAQSNNTDFTFGDSSTSVVNGVIKFYIKMPAEVETVDQITLSTAENIFYSTNQKSSACNSLSLGLKNVTLNEHKFTAYMMTSFETVQIAAEQELTVEVKSGKFTYTKVIVPGEKTLAAGNTNVFQINDQYWTKKTSLSGNGTVSDPYQLNDCDDLLAMSSVLIAGDKVWFKLMNDIDMASIENWTPLNAASPFDKEIGFDGNGKTISNFKCSNVNYASMFGVLYGSCHDITFDRPSITSNVNACGVLGGYIGTGGKPGVVRNVAVVGGTLVAEFRSDFPVGGLAGHAREATIEDCKIDMTVTNKSTSSNNRSATGGIVGKTNSANDVIKNCSFSGAVKSEKNEKYTGGIVGWSGANGANIEKCTVDAMITGNNERIGGVVGHYQGGFISDCTVKGSISSDASLVAGIAGVVSSDLSTISGCDVQSTITTTGSQWNTAGIVAMNEGSLAIDKCTVSGEIKGVNAVAGVVSCPQKPITITNCTVSSKLTGSNYTAGVVADCKAATTVTDCQISSTITAGKYSGGVAAYNSGGDITIEKCVYGGALTASDVDAGGMIGVTCADKNAIVKECAMTGSIKGNKLSFGGIVGEFRNCSGSYIENCYSTGEIVGDQRVGGIVGDMWKWCQVRNCYSTTKINGWQVCGGIIGRAGGNGWIWNADHANVVSKCIAWNESITATRKNANGGSSGAIIGFTGIKNTLADCVRKPEMIFNGSWTDKGLPYDQENSDSDNPLNYQTFTGFDYIYPYWGKAASVSETVSDVARRLGWDESIWDLSADLPMLK